MFLSSPVSGFVVALSGRSPSPKLLEEGIGMGGCETERRSEVGKLRAVDKARTKRSAPFRSPFMAAKLDGSLWRCCTQVGVIATLLGLFLFSAPVFAQRTLTAADAVDVVQSRHRGDVLSVRSKNVGERMIYQVKVLSKSGQVRVHGVDAFSGQLLSSKGKRGGHRRKKR